MNCIRAQRRTGERWHSFVSSPSIWQNAVWEKGFRGRHQNGMTSCSSCLSARATAFLSQWSNSYVQDGSIMFVLPWYHPVLIVTGSADKRKRRKSYFVPAAMAMFGLVGETRR